MNNLDKQYQALLQDILDNGVRKEDRTGTGTLSVFGRQIRHKMSEGFPLLTTKKMYFKGIVTELLWFLRGDTNIKYLVDNDCHIWDGDCYWNYLRHIRKESIQPLLDSGWCVEPNYPTKEEFIDKIKTDDEFAKKWGELGPIYGKQWRSWKGKLVDKSEEFDAHTAWVSEQIDQIANLIKDLKTNPDSRRLMVSAWNVGELDKMTLPPCHYGFQVYTRELTWVERYEHMYNTNVRAEDGFRPPLTPEMLQQYNIPTRAISLMWNQRSVDTFLGLPFNIASYGLLLEIIAKEVNMVPDELIGNLGDTHLYLNHIEQAKEQIGRELSLDERAMLHPNPEMFYEIHGTFSISDSIENSNMPDEDRMWLHKQFDLGGIPKRTREPYPLPKLMICGDMTRTDGFNVSYDELDHSLIKLIDYQSHPTIKAPLSN